MQSAENVVIYVTDRNYSAGLRIYCADRKKTFRSQAKITSPKAVLHGSLPVTVRARNSYNRSQVAQCTAERRQNAEREFETTG